MALFEILCIFAAIFLFVYYYLTTKSDFWEIRGVKESKTSFFENLTNLVTNRIFIGDRIKKMYNEFQDEPMIGFFGGRTPFLILKDPDLIKDVLIKDFNQFADRGIRLHEKVDPLSAHLFSLEPKRWRPLRKNLSPAFTSGKLKDMFYLILKSSDNMEKHLEEIVPQKKPIECRELTAKYTTDVIGSCAFGIDVNAFSDENNEFLRMGKKIFDVGFKRTLRIKIMQLTPWLYDLLGPLITDTEMHSFFINLIKDTMQYRKENNVSRHDFVDLLRHMKENSDSLGDIDLTDSLLAAQANVFYAAGFETSSTTISHALYELAQNTSIQDKLRNEIQESLKKSDGQLTYDGVKNMKYLHKVFQETLRKYPPVPFIMRSSLEKYTFSSTNVTIPKGLRVWIPAYPIQRDPKYYPMPETFDPERFDEEGIQSRHPMLFLPFGDGPRNCIGARFADNQTKVGLIKILKNYRVDVCEKTPIPYVVNPHSFLMRPVDGIDLQFSKLC